MVKFEKHRIFWQIIIWWGAWLLVNVSLASGFESLEKAFLRSIPVLVGVIIIVAINIQVLLPQFFFRGKQLLFVLLSILLLIVTFLLLYHEVFPWSDWFRPSFAPETNILKERKSPPPGFRVISRLTPLVIAFLGSTLVEIARFATQKEKKTIQLEKEKLETELKFLKSQVNPHFLFNALNNIYSLAVVQAPQTPESIMQLSEMLRYIVYDSNEPKVSLKSEISYIENFVELNLLKDSRGMDVQLDLDSTAANIMVAPLLFIPFVENAFKHSRIENLKDGYINIKLSVENNIIAFRVVNSVPQKDFTKDQVGGIGLNNIKKQLQLLYPDGLHELTIQQTDQQFEVNLKICV